MEISANYAYLRHNASLQKCKNPCFQANIMPKLEERLIRDAKASGKLGELVEQFKNVRQWGCKKSFIDTSMNLNDGSERLVLNNFHMSHNYAGDMGTAPKASILTQFLHLNQYNIQKGESSIAKAVEKNKREAAKVIKNTPEYKRALTGEYYPSKSKLNSAIEQLSEEELLGYRFGLNKELTSSPDYITLDIIQ